MSNITKYKQKQVKINKIVKIQAKQAQIVIFNRLSLVYDNQVDLVGNHIVLHGV